MSRRRRDEIGAVAVITVFLATVLMAMTAFTVDLGMAYVTKRQLATSADSASLAGAAIYKNEFVGTCSTAALASQPLVRQNAEAAADSMFLSNYPAALASDGILSTVRCNGIGVEVIYRASGESRAPFGVFAGGDGSISASGEAAAGYPGGVRCAMCFLGSVDAGNADFSVYGGDTHVNGSITAGPNSQWTADTQISVVGTASGSNQNYDPTVTKGPIIPDPYASMVLPLSEAGLTVKSNPCSATSTGGPGIYGAFEFPNSACTLRPGAYVVKGIWSAKNNSVISGPGVTLYVKSTGMLDFKNGMTQNLSAPTIAPVGAPTWPSGFAILYDRDNFNNLSIQGNGNVTITGNVYVPSSKIDFNGNSCLAIDKGTIIANGVVKANGTQACVTLSNAINVEAIAPGNLQLTR